MRLQEHLRNQFLLSAHDGEFEPHFLISRTEAWFSLRGEANSQKQSSGWGCKKIQPHDEKKKKLVFGVRWVAGPSARAV